MKVMVRRSIDWYLKPKLGPDNKPVVGMDNELKALLVLMAFVIAICKLLQWSGYG